MGVGWVERKRSAANLLTSILDTHKPCPINPTLKVGWVEPKRYPTNPAKNTKARISDMPNGVFIKRRSANG